MLFLNHALVVRVNNLLFRFNLLVQLFDFFLMVVGYLSYLVQVFNFHFVHLRLDISLQQFLVHTHSLSLHFVFLGLLPFLIQICRQFSV